MQNLLKPLEYTSPRQVNMTFNENSVDGDDIFELWESMQ